MYNVYQQYCAGLQSSDKFRQLQEDSTQTARVLDFSTNDYLNLSRSKELLDAATIAGSTYGVGATGSRLLSGNREIFETLETQIAKDKNTEAALIFNAGFQANISVLSCLLDSKVLGKKPLVFFDKLNHSSLYNAVFLSGAELIRYSHNNLLHLSELLKKYADTSIPKFIVTETVFGMDGDIADLQEIIALAQSYNAFLYLDEAHATGVLGHKGYGISTDFNLQPINHLIMGTFSKALGCSGAYIACSNIIKGYLVNKSSGFIYSTALSPMVIGAANKAWDMVKHLDDERHALMTKASRLRTTLKTIGFDTGNSETHIIPIIIGTASNTMKTQQQLSKDSIIVSAIRPPTVQPGKSCLRIALTSGHSDEDIDQLIFALKSL